MLTKNLPEEVLEAGDVGLVVHIHHAGAAYEVEFITLTGQTVSVATVLPTQLRPVNQRDISHARSLVAIEPATLALHDKARKEVKTPSPAVVVYCPTRTLDPRLFSSGTPVIRQ